MKKQILCLHYYFPPLRSAAVIRNYHIACTLSDYYDHVHVLSSDNSDRFPQEARTLPDNLTLSTIYTLDYRRLLASKSSKDSHQSNSTKSSSMFQWLLRVQKSFPFNLFMGEGNLIYIIGAYRRAVRLITDHQIDAIYSSFGPYADHYVAYMLKLRFPELRWIADFRDLQVEPIYKNVIWPSCQRSIEKKILSKADLVTTVSDGLSKHMAYADRPIQTIMRGVELRDPTRQYDKFTISYTGSLYMDYRDPRPFLREVHEMIADGLIDAADINMLYAGRDGSQYAEWVSESGLQSIFTNLGMLAQNDAKIVQNRSHINLLLTSSSPELTGVITGKVFEYFESGNPVLCLINGVYDQEFESLFSSLNVGLVAYHPPIDPGALRTFILSKYQEWKSTGSVSSTINRQKIKADYGWHSQIQKIL